jgi:hypothetical protein
MMMMKGRAGEEGRRRWDKQIAPRKRERGRKREKERERKKERKREREGVVEAKPKTGAGSKRSIIISSGLIWQWPEAR